MAPSSPVLARIERGHLCSGCGLCGAIAGAGKVEMAMNADGYLRPVQHGALSADEERLIRETCPGLGLDQRATARRDPLWGPLIRVGTGWAADEEMRHHASSGGVISAVLAYLLESGAVDYVVENTASAERPIENALIESRGRDDVFRAAGSRYAPSAPLARLSEQLARPGRFAFVGKPCDVAALRSYLARHPEARDKVPYILSFFCAGIPSRDGARQIVEKLGLREEEVAAFRFRGDGWPGFATATTRDGRKERMSYADSWGAILSKRVQFRCKICPDGSGGFADLVCADAWYGDDEGYPSFDEAAGRSLVISRTETGDALLDAAREAGYIEVEALDAGEIIKMQPYQAKRKMLIVARLAALAVLARPWPRYRGLDLWGLIGRAGLVENAKNFLGLVRRVVLGRLDG